MANTFSQIYLQFVFAVKGRQNLIANILISDFVKEIKVESNDFINSKNWIKGKFSWQEGYGVFSYSQSHIDAVIQYVLNQETHHQKKTFKQEYLELLEKFEIPFEAEYLFDFIE